MKHGSIIIFIALFATAVCSCRSLHHTVKDTAQRTERAIATDTGHQERVTTDDGRQQSEQFNNEWEDLELVQVHERDTAGNERTVTTVKGHRRKEGVSRQQQEQHREVREDSTAAHHEARDVQEKNNKEAVKKEEPAPVATKSFWDTAGRLLACVALLIVIIRYRKTLRRWAGITEQ